MASTCPQCDGTGEFQYEFGTERCKMCYGTGKLSYGREYDDERERKRRERLESDD